MRLPRLARQDQLLAGEDRFWKVSGTLTSEITGYFWNRLFFSATNPLTRAPCTRSFHPGNFAGLFHVAVWKQFKN